MQTKNKSLLLTSLVVTSLLAGCEQPNQYVPPPPPTVTVARPLQQSVTEYLEFTGTLRAVEEVEIRARVPGFLQSMHFTPGTRVDKGELLFVIDPREFEAELSAAKAELESAKAQVRRARTELDRARRLFKEKAGSEASVVEWRGERDVAQAAVLRAEAQVERAQLNLGYTQVTTPMNGRVSRNLADPGNLVGEGEPTLLTTVTNHNPIYAYFNLNERDLLRALDLYRARVREKGINPDEEGGHKAEIPLQLGLANEEGYPHKGVVDFAESSVDPETGTLQMRGVFPNAEVPPLLYPGLFARLRMPIQESSEALLVSERAIGADQGGRYLLVVNSENMVEKRVIRQGQLVDGMQVIEEGVRPGEWVIVSGLQRARPGAKVSPKQSDMASLTTSALRAGAQTEQERTSPGGDKPASGGESDEPSSAPSQVSTEETVTAAGEPPEQGESASADPAPRP